VRREAEAQALEYKYRHAADMPDAVTLPKKAHGARQVGARFA
jgi:hypothetical protein